ncbi:MAG TPA: tRNA (cytidine(34)-2'-O)-methyltransferase [Candidatus Baltobacteraceae bacterium]
MTQPQTRVVEASTLRQAPLHIVLVEPQIPPNTGNVARLCAATGCALHLVEPLGFSIADRELKRAGLDYWDKLEVVLHGSLSAALAHFEGRAWFLSKRAARRHDEGDYQLGEALFFGKETAGLPAELLLRFEQRTLRIPMRSDSVRSLNLSTAVGIAAYEALGALGFPGLA